MPCRKWVLAVWLTLPFLGIGSTYAAPAIEAWVQRFSNPIHADNQPTKVVTDNNGDVIVAGYSSKAMAVIKYSQSGLQLWTNIFEGYGSGDAVATALAVDGSNNVIVTGYAYGSGSAAPEEYATIKYSSAGIPLWTNTYAGSGNNARPDKAQAVAVDSSGKVFVTGFSYSLDSYSMDYATIAYSSSGALLWLRRYNDAGNWDDVAQAVATDGIGSVFVTGYSGGSDDYVTIKYSNSGLPLWTNLYSGPGQSVDHASMIAVDSNGDAFVTGFSWGSGSSYDYATIKYSNAGLPLWTNRYNGPGNQNDQALALHLDNNGSLIVAGTSIDVGGTSDYATIKYSGMGVPLWTKRYNGPTSSDDVASSVSVDGNNNVYVTGRSIGDGTYDDYATIKYSSAGLPLWTNRYDGMESTNDGVRSLAVGGNGNVYVTGYSYVSEFAAETTTIAYSSTGSPLWTNRYSSLLNAEDSAQGMALDADGNMYVTGYSYSWGGGNNLRPEYVTLKYSTAGVALWTNLYKNAADSNDRARALALDGAGNVFVTGDSSGPVTSSDYATIAYSSNGVPLWTNRFDGQGGAFFNSDNPKGIAVAGNSNVYVTGWSEYSKTPYSRFSTVGYSGLGESLWTNVLTGGSSRGGEALAVGANNRAYVTGYSDGQFGTIAYSSLGVPLWTKLYDGGLGPNVAQAVAVGSNGNVYVTGYSSGDGGYWDYATVAYSSSGMPLWTNRYRNVAFADDAAQALALGNNGNVYVAGYSWSGPGFADFDYATVAYSSLGVPLWTNRYNGPGTVSGSSRDTAQALAVGGNGNVYVTGSAIGNGNSPDIATIAYSSQGMPLWTNLYNGPVNGTDESFKLGIAVGPDGAVYVTGSSYGDSAPDIVTIKYVALPELTIQPLDLTNVVGSSAAFVVAASGTGDLNYQWKREGTNLVNNGDVSGVATNILTLANLTFSDAAAYSVVVTSAYGSTTSIVATLTVVMPASMDITPFLDGSDFVVRYSGTPGIAYTVQSTENLTSATWQKATNLLAPVTDNGLGIGVFELRQALTNEQRFFRVVFPAY